MGKIQGNIENGYTLPERRTACRQYDVPVSTKEYKRLRDLGKNPVLVHVRVSLDKIQEGTAQRCEKLMVTMGKGPKAAKASALHEHDKEKRFKDRTELICREIVDAIIADLKVNRTLQDFIGGCMSSEDSTFRIDDIKVPSMGWADDEDLVVSSSNEDSCTTNEDSRVNFLCTRQRSVEIEVGNRIRELLKIEFNGESIWDSLRVKVDLRKGEGGNSRSSSVNADVFFARIE